MAGIICNICQDLLTETPELPGVAAANKKAKEETGDNNGRGGHMSGPRSRCTCEICKPPKRQTRASASAINASNNQNNQPGPSTSAGSSAAAAAIASTSAGAQKSDAASAVVIAMTCGHIYHQDCITQWFEKLIADGSAGNKPNNKRLVSHNCPTCHAKVTLKKGVRLYLQQEQQAPPTPKPIAAAPSGRNVQLRIGSPVVPGGPAPKKRKLTDNEAYELEQMSTLLENTGTELEDKKKEIDELKMRNALLASELEAVKFELQETRARRNMNNSFR